MSQKYYPEVKQLDLPATAADVLAFWEKEKIFQQSVENRKDAPGFTFYEGPPSANGMPGIHHVMGRTIKDIFCRYKTSQGFRVERKAGWDTHGLPVELQVEKELGITKEDIGKSISIEDYNAACRTSVMKYTDVWNQLTQKMGYWVDMEHPYVTYQTKYMESVWWLLAQFYKKDLLYKGFSIQPFSPAAGTGLSSAELNMPGCYRPVKDTTVVAQFKLKPGQQVAGKEVPENTFILAWTTTPWTLPSNTALAVGEKINYVRISCKNPYTGIDQQVILAEVLVEKYFKGEEKDTNWYVLDTFSGKSLVGLRYEQLLPYAQPSDGDAFKVIPGDFITTEDGTGVVHISPTHGSDDFRAAKQNGIGSLLLVDRQGRFTAEVTDYAGEYVKEEYLSVIPEGYKNVDVRIAIRLKEENRAFKVEKYEHSYPHCWRTDKPVIYYPLDSWFIRTTAIKERLQELNTSIRWKPESTGTGRFGNWLENLLDWNLSRSRYWGVPIPIWRTEDGSEQVCIGSVEELVAKIDESIRAGFMKSSPYAGFVPGDMSDENYQKVDLHRPYADEIVLVSPSGKPMRREADLIDVWFDSGAMPYAQLHYPFENKERVDSGKSFPADFIAEGVDQTRGWFFTLHVIAGGIFDSIAYKNVVSNGLVLDKTGQKMSKRLGNTVDPFAALDKYGADAVRWYMLTNANPWDNLKFDLDGVVESQRKFFGTLHNTYAFFALYANVDGFRLDEQNRVPVTARSEFDQWIISELQTLNQEVTASYEDYDATRAGRLIQDFVSEKLSNWYVRLSRRRFWRGEMTQDKKAAYETLHECLVAVSQLMSPIAPFYADALYNQLTASIREAAVKNNTPLRFPSVHTTRWVQAEPQWIRKDLENSMELAQRITSMVFSLRKKHKIRVRQPLQKMLIPVLDASLKSRVEQVKDLILAEVNVKELELLEDTSGILVKKIKADFKKLGPRFGKQMKEAAAQIGALDQAGISRLEREGKIDLPVGTVLLEEVEILSEDIPGWLVLSENGLTVALDITISDDLRFEGIARDLVNRIQNLRKEQGLEVTDRIHIKVKPVGEILASVNANFNYICTEVLADSLELSDSVDVLKSTEIELEDDLRTRIELTLVKLQ